MQAPGYKVCCAVDVCDRGSFHTRFTKHFFCWTYLADRVSVANASDKGEERKEKATKANSVMHNLSQGNCVEEHSIQHCLMY